MWEIVRRECVYLWYYVCLQVQLIVPYWVLGLLLGSAVSVFLKDRIASLFLASARTSEPQNAELRTAELQNAAPRFGGKKNAEPRTVSFRGLVPASLLGIASPLCMYGTVPLAASFSVAGAGDGILAAFMTASVLLNPQLLLYTAALGKTAVAVRFASCLLCGVAAGFAVRLYCRVRGKPFFKFTGFSAATSRDTDPNAALRYLKNLWRNVRATGPWFLAGIAAAAAYQRYVPAEVVGRLFGKHEAFGLLTAAALGVPLYVCGGGTVALMAGWLADGMSMGAAAAFMISGPATKITNLGALKTVLGSGHFFAYIGFSVVFAAAAGFVTDLFC
ncbi:permease [Treponema brennaborense]|uniref:Permease n=1 Tax=Treponema brennaborense (strain DSM 12168 / CIP 105900 / DD5/3) TaxID=906968 RepID=F4LLB4_TREBD|nr:permease [Treponema brennaborense]AEE15592.1 Protein of unknown function DUF318, transmembrane [Treponema brennaborense DSM 12168]